MAICEFQPRNAGALLHISSLPGPHGIGEIGEGARRFVDFLASGQLNVWQFLPTGPTGFGDSPYQALSAFAGNELLIDIAALVDMGLLHAGEARGLADLLPNSVDFAELIPIKSALLDRAAERFELRADSALKSEFDQFRHVHADEWLRDYALFRSLKMHHAGRAWPQWARKFRRRNPRALRSYAAKMKAQLDSIMVSQFLFERQWRQLREYAGRRGVQLFGDMPMYIALDSCDAWANRELLQMDRDGHMPAVAGVPPDYFSEDGQLWGNPLYDWRHHRRSGYGWWKRRLKQALGQCDLVRIDHFRALESYWSVPSEADSARIGEWHSGPGDALLDALADSFTEGAAKTRGKLPIVAEDLGMITPQVHELRDRHQLRGMEVLQFALLDEDFEAANIGENMVCYTGTHDNDTCQGWYQGGPDDPRTAEEIVRVRRIALEATGGAPETIHLDMLRLALSTPANLTVAPMQDYLGLGSEARLNTPGMASGNWRWRMVDEQLTSQLAETVTRLVSDSGRQT